MGSLTSYGTTLEQRPPHDDQWSGAVLVRAFQCLPKLNPGIYGCETGVAIFTLKVASAHCVSSVGSALTAGLRGESTMIGLIETAGAVVAWHEAKLDVTPEGNRQLACNR